MAASVIVTGASRGLGLGMARALAENGYHAIAIARHESEALTHAITAAVEEGRGMITFVPYDLTRIEGLASFVKGLRQRLGPIYGLINNAGLGTDGLLVNMREADIERLVRLNTLSPIVLSKHVLRSMLSAGEGRIVNVASVIGFTGYAGLSAYGATKAALIGFTRSLAREVGRANITVNAVAPGFIATDMTEGLAEEQREQVVRRSALRRLASVEDVANAVLFLLSDKASSITGTVVTVDAGGTA